MSLNSVYLRGNLTRDPEKRFLPSGTAVVNFGLAVNRRYRSGDEWKEETCFVDIVVFGKQGEWSEEQLGKGSPVLVEGRLAFNSWETKEGERRSKHEVVAYNVHFIKPRDASFGGQTGSQAASLTEDTYDSSTIKDDDIPF
tara:strand:- start:21480 stop:21902 length:423 start_codon:yes stop_codon:yes gene_type:complete